MVKDIVMLHGANEGGWYFERFRGVFEDLGRSYGFRTEPECCAQSSSTMPPLRSTIIKARSIGLKERRWCGQTPCVLIASACSGVP